MELQRYQLHDQSEFRVLILAKMHILSLESVVQAK